MGFMILVVLTASIYILLPDKVRIDVEGTKTTFKVWENGQWVLAGTERTILFDGTTKMRAKSRNIEYFINGNKTKIVRTANFKQNITAIDTYLFDGTTKDVGLYPISHDVEIINGIGKIFVYEVNDLEYFGETIKDISSPQTFGHNMKIEWQDGNYYSKIYKYKNKDIGKLTIKYRLNEAYEKFNVRLFDPYPWDDTTPTITLNFPVNNYNYTSTKSIDFNCTGAGPFGINNVTFYLNGTGNETNTTGINNTAYIFTKTISDGFYNWTCGVDVPGSEIKLYDNFNDNSLDTNLWTETETPGVGTATVNEQNQRIEIDCSITSGSGQEAEAYLDSDHDYLDYLKWTATTVSQSASHGGFKVSVSVGGTIIVDKGGAATYDDYTTGTWELKKTGTTENKLYKDGDYVRTFGALGGTVRFYDYAGDGTNLGTGTINHDFDTVYLNVSNISIIYDNNATVRNFTIETANPQVNVTSPLNQTLSSIHPWFNFTSNRTISRWIINYNGTNTTLTPNQQLHVINGFYHLFVYAIDDHENVGLNDTIYFTAAQTVNLSMNFFYVNLSAELGSTIILNASTNTIDYVCLNIDHPDYGTNYSCSIGSNSLNFTPAHFSKTTFANGSTNQTYSYSSAQEEFFNISINTHIYDEVDNLIINLSQGSGNPEDVTFYFVNTTPTFNGTALDSNSTSFIDRAFHGLIVGSNLYLNEFFDGDSIKNISFPVASKKTVYFMLDDDIVNKVYTLFFNITGYLFGFDYTDGSASVPTGFDNYSNIDTDLTTAHLDASGHIMAKNVSETLYFYDDFEDGELNQTLWVNSTCTTGAQTACVSETGGSLFLELDLQDAAGGAIVQSLLLDKAESDTINFSIVADYLGYDHTTSTITPTTYIKFGGTTIWNLTYLDHVAPATDESADANLDFYLYKINKTHWGYRIYGTENATAGGNPNSPWGNVRYGTEKFVNVSTSQLYFYEYLTASGDRGTNDLYVEYMNRNLWTRENSTVISKSIYDASGDITQARLWVWTKNAAATPNEDLYAFLSADDGENWENVWGNGTLHTFSNVGRHLRWRFDFNITGDDDDYLTTQIGKVNISMPSGYPENITFDFGGDDSIEYTFEGQLNSSNSPETVNLSGTNLSLAFDSSTQYWNHTYRIPLIISSNTTGLIKINVINLTYNPNPISLNASRIQSHLDNSDGSFLNFTIPISYNNNTETDASVIIDDLKYDYAGGSDTITISAYNIVGDLEVIRNITFYYSRWDYSFMPQFVNWLEFIPSTPTSKNVTPFGQTPIIPILNITNYGYGGINTNLSIYLNETLGCVNLTMSLTENKADGFIINDSWQNLTGLTYLETINISLWADFECSYSGWHLFEPYLYFRQCGVGCYCSEEVS